MIFISNYMSYLFSIFTDFITCVTTNWGKVAASFFILPIWLVIIYFISKTTPIKIPEKESDSGKLFFSIPKRDCYYGLFIAFMLLINIIIPCELIAIVCYSAVYIFFSKKINTTWNGIRDAAYLKDRLHYVISFELFPFILLSLIDLDILVFVVGSILGRFFWIDNTESITKLLENIKDFSKTKELKEYFICQFSLYSIILAMVVAIIILINVDEIYRDLLISLYMIIYALVIWLAKKIIYLWNVLRNNRINQQSSSYLKDVQQDKESEVQ